MFGWLWRVAILILACAGTLCIIDSFCRSGFMFGFYAEKGERYFLRCKAGNFGRGQSSVMRFRGEIRTARLTIRMWPVRRKPFHSIRTGELAASATPL